MLTAKKQKEVGRSVVGLPDLRGLKGMRSSSRRNGPDGFRREGNVWIPVPALSSEKGRGEPIDVEILRREGSQRLDLSRKEGK